MEGPSSLMTRDCEKHRLQYEFEECEIISFSPMVTEK